MKLGSFPIGEFIDSFFYLFCKQKNLIALFSACLFHFVVFICQYVVITSSDHLTYARAHTDAHFNYLLHFFLHFQFHVDSSVKFFFWLAHYRPSAIPGPAPDEIVLPATESIGWF